MDTGFKQGKAVYEDAAIEMAFPNGYTVHVEWEASGVGDALVWVYGEDGGMIPLFGDSHDWKYLSPVGLTELLSCVARTERGGEINL